MFTMRDELRGKLDEIREAVASCPTGALTLHDGHRRPGAANPCEGRPLTP